MHRRELLKTLTGIFGMAITMPSWAEGWTSAAISKPTLLSKEQKKLLGDVVDTIIPRTDTPGASDLGVQDFVELMVQDCFEKPVQEQLGTGLARLDKEAKNKFGQGFSALKAAQKLDLVKSLAGKKDSEADFLNSVKNLTIQGYTSSEYFMTNVTKYELIPARYHGCVDIGS
ncbi:MAG: hypothetical protein ABS46_17525 [Cytophagaceae bacterium SCN 52-12]|nr:MAG: hypothetical protein ABS46_17525 [Cytophagaceae bacterium SCN 52-12]